MSVSTLSPAVQHSIINAANISVSRYAKAFCDKIGNKHFFSPEDLEDIAGTTVYKACRSFETYTSEKGKISTWISQIAFNALKDAIDYKMKRLAISCPMFTESQDTRDEYSEDEFFEESNPDEKAVYYEYSADVEVNRKDFELRVNHEISKLSAKNQKYASLLIDGYTPKEMAAIEGCTANAAAKRIWSIRQTLKETLLQVSIEFDVYCDRLAS